MAETDARRRRRIAGSERRGTADDLWAKHGLHPPPQASPYQTVVGCAGIRRQQEPRGFRVDTQAAKGFAALQILPPKCRHPEAAGAEGILHRYQSGERIRRTPDSAPEVPASG